MLLATGDKAPDFNLPNQDGDDIALDNFKGSKIVLWFYPKASTPGWTIEGQGFRDELQKFVDMGIHIIGVSADSIKKQKNFHTKQQF